MADNWASKSNNLAQNCTSRLQLGRVVADVGVVVDEVNKRFNWHLAELVASRFASEMSFEHGAFGSRWLMLRNCRLPQKTYELANVI